MKLYYAGGSRAYTDYGECLEAASRAMEQSVKDDHYNNEGMKFEAYEKEPNNVWVRITWPNGVVRSMGMFGQQTVIELEVVGELESPA